MKVWSDKPPTQCHSDYCRCRALPTFCHHIRSHVRPLCMSVLTMRSDSVKDSDPRRCSTKQSRWWTAVLEKQVKKVQTKYANYLCFHSVTKCLCLCLYCFLHALRYISMSLCWWAFVFVCVLLMCHQPAGDPMKIRLNGQMTDLSAPVDDWRRNMMMMTTTITGVTQKGQTSIT